jgi:transcriptional regulator with XRE-family HTH domain
LREKFGKRVVALRKAAKLSQEELADSCEFARSYMSRIERGTARATLDTVERIAKGLNVPPSKLFE